MISQDTIDKCIEAARVEDVVGDFVDLKKAGSSYKACCPFHGEKTPSFNVSPSRGLWKCFGCNRGGDAVAYLRETGMSFPDAIVHLARKYSIEVVYTTQEPDPLHDKRQQIRATLMAVQAHLAAKEDNPGRKYWKDRAYTDETLDAYGIGYAESAVVPLVEGDALQAAGIGNDKGNLSCYKRTTIPLHDYRGNIVSLCGRTITNEAGTAKYINGREVTGVYEKGKYLFNLHRADKAIREKGEVWLVEGYADSMALTQMKVANNLALSGKEVTENHVAALRRYSEKQQMTFVIGIDAETDPAQSNYNPSTARSLWAAVQALLPLGEVKLAQWPRPCKDAGDMLPKGMGIDSVKLVDAIQHLVLNTCTETWQTTSSPVQKAMFQDQIAQMIAAVRKDNVRDVYINESCNLLQIKPKKMEELVKQFQAAGTQTEEKKRVGGDYDFIVVRDDYFQRLRKPNSGIDGDMVIYVPRRVAELKLEKGLEFVKRIERFHDWIIEPSHTNYRRVVKHFVTTEGNVFSYFNRYHPLPVEPKPFTLPDGFINDPKEYDYEQIKEIANTARFMKHIFGHRQHGNRWVSLAWDWLTILYLMPRQRIPAMALVSSAEGTGKSTFINLCLKMFGENAAKTDASRINANFNGMMSGKVFVGVEETKDEKGSIENKLKDLITGFEMVVERKHQEATVEESFAKFCFASNHEDSFMKVGTATTRFFVVKVEPIPAEDYDPNFEEKLYREIPYVFNFMQTRKVLYNGGKPLNRLFFDPNDLENEALLKLREASKDIVQQNLESLINNVFLRCEYPQPIVKFDSAYIKQVMHYWGGKLYEQKTPNYFLKVCTNDMKCVYVDKTARFETIQLNGIASLEWPNHSMWEYDSKPSRGRSIEFPVWKFCQPREMTENYGHNNLNQLVANMEKQMTALTAVYGDAPAIWLDTLKAIVSPAPVVLQVDLPF